MAATFRKSGRQDRRRLQRNNDRQLELPFPDPEIQNDNDGADNAVESYRRRRLHYGYDD
jgi:hypothetical protein